jgi:folate-binding protein YgfZ
MPITTDVGLLAQDAVLGPAAASPRELVVATGVDRIRFLHGLVTGNVAGTEPGRGCRAALLTPKGQVVSDLRIFVRPDDVRIVVDAGQAAPLATALARYAIMDDFAAAPVPEFSLFSLLGPTAPAQLAAAGFEVGALTNAPPLAHAEIGNLWIARVRELGADGFWIGGAPADVASLRERLATTVPELDAAAAEAARIDALEPRFGVEITADYFPMEVGLGGAIDYTKGCYLGQEPIVRVRDRGHINWRLCGLDIVGAADPRPGDPLTSDVKPKAGKVTSAARLPDGRGVALAMAHVSLPVGATVHIGADAIEARIRAEVP